MHSHSVGFRYLLGGKFKLNFLINNTFSTIINILPSERCYHYPTTTVNFLTEQIADHVFPTSSIGVNHLYADNPCI